MDVFASAIEELESTESPVDRVLTELGGKLGVIIEALSALDDAAEGHRFETSLERLLSAISKRAASLVSAAALDVFRYDAVRGELFSVRDGVEVRLPVEGGAIGEALSTSRPVVLGPDLYDDSRGRSLRRLDEITNTRSYTALLVPLVGESQNALGLVCARNHLREGFGESDERALVAVASVLCSILEVASALRDAIQNQRAVTALMHATSSISRSSLDLEETLKRVMDEAKELMSADRSTLWLVDREAKQLWTKIQSGDEMQELRIPMNAGFAGLVATTGKPVNIPFDLYDHPNAYTAKQVDQKTGYRTCSLLCLPVLNADDELIAVTQLVNKKRSEDGAPYDPATWPAAPDCWKASFTRADQEYMAAFNQQAGVALQNAKLFATVKQQEQMQRDILHNLSNGVVATDETGRVIAANESAIKILGLPTIAAVEGRQISDLIRVQEADFGAWLATAQSPPDEKSRQQYYPEQVLIAADDEQRSANLSISSMADATDPSRTSGVIVVLDDISEEKRLKNTMYRYMTQELAEQLLQSADSIRMGGDRKHVSVLFSDIRSYTTLTESMEPEDVVKLLNEYFESMVEAIFNFKGTLDKYIGDAIMAVYGSPLAIEDHAWCAVQTAIEMRHRLEEFNAHRTEARLSPILIGIGINSDEVVSGNIGSSKRMEFTAVGDGINLGSRLEGVTKLYGVDTIISEETFRLCGDRAVCRELDTIRVKGKSEKVAIYELVEVNEGPLARPIPDAKLKQLDHYRAGRELYVRREFTRALASFERALKATPGDKASLLHLERCKSYLEDAPPEQWSGVWEMKEK